MDSHPLLPRSIFFVSEKMYSRRSRTIKHAFCLSRTHLRQKERDSLSFWGIYFYKVAMRVLLEPKTICRSNISHDTYFLETKKVLNRPVVFHPFLPYPIYVFRLAMSVIGARHNLLAEQ